MNNKPHITSLWRTAYIALLLPFMLMSLLPQGVMPTRSAVGMEIVICTGEGAFTMVVDQDGNPVDHGNEPCSWSVHYLDIAIGTQTIGNAITHVFAPNTQSQILPALFTQTALSRYTPRGPPVFA